MQFNADEHQAPAKKYAQKKRTSRKRKNGKKKDEKKSHEPSKLVHAVNSNNHAEASHVPSYLEGIVAGKHYFAMVLSSGKRRVGRSGNHVMPAKGPRQTPRRVS
jgi:hypothetical protein